jgi:pilus assembly protein Flp/PilA
MSTPEMLWRCMRRTIRERHQGQGLVEYALIIVLIAIVSITILTTLGGSIRSVFSRANAGL